MTSSVRPSEMSEFADDRVMRPLVQRALCAQVNGQEPSPTVWPAIRRRVAAGGERPSLTRWATLSAAAVAVVFALVVSYSYQELDRTGLNTPDCVLQPLALDPGTVASAANENKARQTLMRLLPDPAGSDPQWSASSNAAGEGGANTYPPDTPPNKQTVPGKPQPTTQGSPAFLRFTRGARAQPL